MSSILLVNLVLMAVVLCGMVGLHHWAIRTQHRDWPADEKPTRRTGHERRVSSRNVVPACERRRVDRRLGGVIGAQ